MQLTLSQHDGYVLAKTDGPLDETAREAFREQLHPLVATSGGRLFLDLSDSPRINSSGIGHLVALVADANTNGSRVVLCRLQPFVAGVMSVTGLDRFFEIAASVEKGLNLAAAKK